MGAAFRESYCEIHNGEGNYGMGVSEAVQGSRSMNWILHSWRYI